MNVSITKHTFLLRPQIRLNAKPASNSPSAQPSSEQGSACIISLPGPWWSGWHPLMMPSNLSAHSAYPHSHQTSLAMSPDRLLLVIKAVNGMSHAFPQGNSQKCRLNGNHLPLGQSWQGSGDHLGGMFSWRCETVQRLVFFRANEWFGKLGSSLLHPALPLYPCLKSLNDNVIASAENFAPCLKKQMQMIQEGKHTVSLWGSGSRS